MAEKACQGGRTLPTTNDMEECQHCGRAVAWDLTESQFFGFQNCNEKDNEK